MDNNFHLGLISNRAAWQAVNSSKDHIGEGSYDLVWGKQKDENQNYVHLLNFAVLADGEELDALYPVDGSITTLINCQSVWVQDGYITGKYPWLKLPDKAIFECEVGFLSGVNSGDAASFQIWASFKDEGRKYQIQLLNHEKTHDPHRPGLTRLKVDLSSLSLKKVSLELRLKTNSSNAQNKAVWKNPRFLSRVGRLGQIWKIKPLYFQVRQLFRALENPYFGVIYWRVVLGKAGSTTIQIIDKLHPALPFAGIPDRLPAFIPNEAELSVVDLATGWTKGSVISGEANEFGTALLGYEILAVDRKSGTGDKAVREQLSATSDAIASHLKLLENMSWDNNTEDLVDGIRSALSKFDNSDRIPMLEVDDSASPNIDKIIGWGGIRFLGVTQESWENSPLLKKLESLQVYPLESSLEFEKKHLLKIKGPNTEYTICFDISNLSPKLPELPNSDIVLSCFVNLDGAYPVLSGSPEDYRIDRHDHSKNYRPKLSSALRYRRFQDDLLVIDMSSPILDVPNPLSLTWNGISRAKEYYDASREVFEVEFPNILLGSYISGPGTRPFAHTLIPYDDQRSTVPSDYQLQEGKNKCEDGYACPNFARYPITMAPQENFDFQKGLILKSEYRQGCQYFPYRFIDQHSGKEEIYCRGYVDYRDPVAAEHLRRFTVDEVRRRGVTLLYSDNWDYQTLPKEVGEQKGAPTREDMSSYLRTLRRDLHSIGARLVINASWSLGTMAYEGSRKAGIKYNQARAVQELETIELLSRSVDGVTFEIPVHPNLVSTIVTNPSHREKLVEHSIACYRRLLDKGVLVAMMDAAGHMRSPQVSQSIQDETENLQKTENIARQALQVSEKYVEKQNRPGGRGLAAWAMMIRQPGDKFFVCKDATKPKPEWMFWPQVFGQGVGACMVKADTQTNRVKVSREFINGKITIELSEEKGKTVCSVDASIL